MEDDYSAMMSTARLVTGSGESDEAGTSWSLVLPARSAAAPEARRAARRFVRRLAPRVVDRVAQDIDLVVTELVTNAVRHARGATCTLILDARPDAVEVTVVDEDPTPPRPHAPDFSGCLGGFGWPMVRRLARQVTVALIPDGKAVCALVPR
ncbi:ATP-binding protein [Streptomyces sp. SID10815]|uniref:ATP-binding protein n=1 Tax=Streptomyces sp. SID10815 TaxID=2706027 RepID=UPI001EF3B1B3|nr:ATP-binding protein [Streptomyces sp. SID10815]